MGLFKKHTKDKELTSVIADVAQAELPVIPVDEITSDNVDKNKDIWEIKELISTKEEGESIHENRRGFDINSADFGPLEKYIINPNITDIDFNGTDLWLTDIENKHWKDTETPISPAFIRKLASNIANSDSIEFNQQNPIIEAESDDLRISTIHNSIATTGTTICIRKTPKKNRIKECDAVTNGYCSIETLSLLVNCIKAHMNIVICGEPRAGKTECAKFLSGYIPDTERVITIEDVMEWHYKALNPTADVIEMKVNDVFDYSKGIIASLKQNPKWIMIAETRGKEVKNLLQSLTTGVNGITTLHTDDVRKIVERMVNMADDSITANRMENNIYEFVDVGVFITMFNNGHGGQSRQINQIAFFAHDNEQKECCVVLDDGKLVDTEIPEKIKKKFLLADIKRPLENDTVIEKLKEQDFDFSNRKIVDYDFMSNRTDNRDNNETNEKSQEK